MEALADAAVGASPAAQPTPTTSPATEQSVDQSTPAPAPESAASAAPKKRSRSTKLEMAQKKVDANADKLAKKSKQLAALEQVKRTPKVLESIERVAAEIAALDREHASLQKQLNDVRKQVAAKEEHAAQKQLKVAAAVERARSMSEAGIMKLVALRMQYNHRFENTSDTNDNVWQHIERDFNALIDKGDLPPTDRRASLSSLKDKCATCSRSFVYAYATT